jgi:membrane protein implicated in regulation of membrane protease activity
MDAILYWHWLVLGLALLTLEMFTPSGFVLLWMGVSALIVGAVASVLPGAAELVLFSVLSIATIVLFKRFRPAPAPSDAPTLNRRGESYVGRVFTLGDPIINGVGKLRVDDSQWRITGPDLPPGSQVKVVRADGATLQVERAS